LAYENSGRLGNGSFRIALHDAVSRMDEALFEKRAKYHEE